MKKELLEKLAAILAKAEKDRTSAEKASFTELSAQAKEANIDVTKEAVADAIKALEGDEEEEETTATTDEELKSLISEAVTKSLKGTGVSTEDITKSIEEAVKANGSSSLTAKAIEDIVKEHAGGGDIDQEALLKAMKEAVPKDALTSADLTKALEKFAETVRTPAKSLYEDPMDSSYPIKHRSGNLTVGEKQLLNICLMHVSDEQKSTLEEKGVSIPKSMNDGISKDQLSLAKSQGERAVKKLRSAKALTTTGVNSGAELIPSDLSGELMTRMFLESQLAGEMVSQEIEMPTSPFEFPLRTTRTNFYVGSEAPTTDPTESTPGTGNITLAAKKLIGFSEYSYESDEDGIIAVMPMLLDNMAQGAANALEGAIINGDVSGTHQDSDVAAVVGHHAKLFTGFRKHALAGGLDVDLSTGGVSASNIAAMRKKMGIYGIRPRDLILIVGPQGYNDIVSLQETLTFEKVGNQNAARILTGEAASIYGIRIVVSSQIREDLNASGVYDGTTTTKGSMLLVHKPSYIMGVKRGMTVEVDVNKKRQINEVIASFRRDFVPKETPSASIPTAILGRNYNALA